MNNMKMVFRIVGGMLLLVLVAWIGMRLLDANNRPVRALPGEQGLFYSAKDIPASARGEIDKAIAVRGRLGDRYRAYALASDIAAWISFGATALATLLVGTFNLQQAGAASSAAPKPGRFYLLGFLSAVASVATLLGNQTGKEATETLASHDKLHAQVIETITVLKNKPDEEAKVLADLSATVERIR